MAWQHTAEITTLMQSYWPLAPCTAFLHLHNKMPTMWPLQPLQPNGTPQSPSRTILTILHGSLGTTCIFCHSTAPSNSHIPMWHAWRTQQRIPIPTPGGIPPAPTTGQNNHSYQPPNPSKRYNNDNYCFACGYDIPLWHTSATCNCQKHNHQVGCMC